LQEKGVSKHKMKLSDYIREQISLGTRDFDVRINKDQTMNDNGLVRVKFKVRCKDDV